MITWLMYMHQLDHFYKSYHFKNSFGVTGVKRSFSLKKYCNSSMLHSMTIRVIHVHHLATLYLCYGVKCQSGVNWGHWGQRSFSLKKILLLQITRYGHMIHAHASAWPPLQSYPFKNSSGVIWGHRGQKVIFTKNAITRPCYIAWP